MMFRLYMMNDEPKKKEAKTNEQTNSQPTNDKYKDAHTRTQIISSLSFCLCGSMLWSCILTARIWMSFAVWIWPDCCRICRSTERFSCAAAIGKRAIKRMFTWYACTHAYVCMRICVVDVSLWFVKFITFDEHEHHIRIQRIPHVYARYRNEIPKQSNTILYYRITHTFPLCTRLFTKNKHKSHIVWRICWFLSLFLLFLLSMTFLSVSFDKRIRPLSV